jgi:outer membrane protein
MILMFVFLGVQAQENKTFGFLSYEAALQSMPDYAKAQQKIETLKAQYQAETKRVEDEFNRKYEEFLEGQREFPKTILQKRQTELQELMARNIQFKENSRQELAQIEKETLAPLKIRLIELLGQIGRERGYAFIYDTDTNALPFLNPAMGDDLNQLVRNALK